MYFCEDAGIERESIQASYCCFLDSAQIFEEKKYVPRINMLFPRNLSSNISLQHAHTSIHKYHAHEQPKISFILDLT